MRKPAYKAVRCELTWAVEDWAGDIVVGSSEPTRLMAEYLAEMLTAAHDRAVTIMQHRSRKAAAARRKRKRAKGTRP